MRGGIAWLAMMLGLVGCQAPPPAPGRRPNVVLIVVDTLRADRLGSYGNRRGLTPFLDELAGRGHVMRETRAQASWTSPSVASIFTSRFQSQHGIVDHHSVLAEAELTLAEVFKAAGYVTGAFSANGLIGSSLGFSQGFDRFDAHLMVGGGGPAQLRSRRAEEMTAAALGWLDGVHQDAALSAPVFLYVHLMEPHPPYAPPPALLARLRGARPPVDLQRANEAMYYRSLTLARSVQLEEILDAYDASVMAVDEALRGFVAALEQRRVLDDAVVVVTADHGEELQEHGYMGHGKTLYDEVLRVPLIVVRTGATAGTGVVERLISSIDIAPTVLELAGVAVPPPFEGVPFTRDLDESLRGRLRRVVDHVFGREAVSVSYSEHLRPATAAATPLTPHERAVVLDAGKLIRWRGGELQFFALDLDPAETSANAVEEAERLRLTAQLAAAEARAERNRTPAEVRALDQRLRESLRALGYVE